MEWIPDKEADHVLFEFLGYGYMCAYNSKDPEQNDYAPDVIGRSSRSAMVTADTCGNTSPSTRRSMTNSMPRNSARVSTWVVSIHA